jgi:hypothetical protein
MLNQFFYPLPPPFISYLSRGMIGIGHAGRIGKGEW